MMFAGVSGASQADAANHEAAQLAVDQLVANGYRKIAMLAPPLYDPITPRVERIEGYKASTLRA